MIGATTSNNLNVDNHDFVSSHRSQDEKFRVAHIIKDEAGNLHYREAWLLMKYNPADDVILNKQLVEVKYADTGEIKMVPAGKIKIMGQLSSSVICVGQMIVENGQPKFKMGTIQVGSVLDNKVWVRYDGDETPVSVKASDLIVIGRQKYVRNFESAYFNGSRRQKLPFNFLKN